MSDNDLALVLSVIQLALFLGLFYLLLRLIRAIEFQNKKSDNEYTE